MLETDEDFAERMFFRDISTVLFDDAKLRVEDIVRAIYLLG